MSEMKLTSQVTKSGFVGSEAGVKATRIGPLARYDARIAGEIAACNWPCPTSTQTTFGRAAREKHMGEAAGRGADVETAMPGGIEAESIESSGELDAAARDPRIGRRGFDMATA